MTVHPQRTQLVMDHLELSIGDDTMLEAGEPLRIEGTKVNVLRLHVGGGGQTVTVWIDRAQVTRLIGAIVAAAHVPLPEPEPERAPIQVHPENMPVEADAIPF